MKAKAKQSEFNWAEPESFALVGETAIDGQRQADEKAQQQRDRREAETKQTGFVIESHE